jgi:hypothetical protein
VIYKKRRDGVKDIKKSEPGTGFALVFLEA